jgi:fructokinase
VGESLVDVVVADGTTTERPGGSAANVAVALARLGRPVRLATSYGDDARGAAIAAHLAADGVDAAGEPRVLERTSVARARIGSDGAASYDFDLEWRLGTVETGAPRVVHVCSLGAVLAPGCADVLALVDSLRPDATVTYDINARPALTGTGPEVVARVEAMVARADLVKASDEDLLALWPDRDLTTSARALLALGPAAVVVTRGPDGATWYAADGAAGAVMARTVEVVDTIGAGDTFGAGLLDALWDRLGARLGDVNDETWSRAVDHAARCAAVTVGRIGADPPRHDEVPGSA